VEPRVHQRGHQPDTDALAHTPLGPYQLQAAIAAVHAEADRAEDTDWPQIVGLYQLLERLAPIDGDAQSRRRGRQWWMALGPGLLSSNLWTAMTGWPGTIACTRSGRTCWKWPAITRPPGPATRPPRG